MSLPSRETLARAVGLPCPYCGKPMDATRPPTRDHIKPRRRGGTLADPANKAIVCAVCNTDKRAKSLAAFLVSPILGKGRMIDGTLSFATIRPRSSARPGRTPPRPARWNGYGLTSIAN